MAISGEATFAVFEDPFPPPPIRVFLAAPFVTAAGTQTATTIGGTSVTTTTNPVAGVGSITYLTINQGPAGVQTFGVPNAANLAPSLPQITVDGSPTPQSVGIGFVPQFGSLSAILSDPGFDAAKLFAARAEVGNLLPIAEVKFTGARIASDPGFAANPNEWRATTLIDLSGHGAILLDRAASPGRATFEQIGATGFLSFDDNIRYAGVFGPFSIRTASGYDSDLTVFGDSAPQTFSAPSFLSDFTTPTFLNEFFGGGGPDTFFGGVTSSRFFGEDGDDVFLGPNADLNNDGVVDVADLVVARQNPEFIDLNLDGRFDAIFREEFGQTNLFEGGAGNDTIFVQGSTLRGVTRVSGGAGTDIVVGAQVGTFQPGAMDGLRVALIDGGADDDVLGGGPLGEFLFGGDGNDFVISGGGPDRLAGGAGLDNYFGGPGAQLFLLESTDPANVDGIFDFNAAEGDRIGIVGAAGVQPQLVLAPGFTAVFFNGRPIANVVGDPIDLSAYISLGF